MRALPSAYTLWTRLFRLWDRQAQLAPKSRLGVENLEDRFVPAGRPLPYPVLYVGAGIGDAPLVRAYAGDTGDLMFEEQVYASSFTGGVQVATGDMTGDGFPDLIVAPGAGGGPNVRVLDGHTGEQIEGELGSFWAFEESFTGGVRVAAADVDGDGIPDIIAAAGAGGGPRVKVFSGADASVLSDVYVFEPDFTGGVSIGAADFDGDGMAELVVGAGMGGGPRVKTYHPLTGNAVSGPLADFFAFDESFRGGVNIGTDALASDVDGDEVPDVAVGSGPGMASAVKVFSGTDGDEVRSFSPFGSSTVGVTVATMFADNDEYADVAAGTGPGVTSTVRVFSGLTSSQLASPLGEYSPFGSSTGGVELAASNDPITPTVAWLSIDPAATVVGQATAWTVELTGATVGMVDYRPAGPVKFTAIDTTTSDTFEVGTVDLVPTGAITAEATIVVSSLPEGEYDMFMEYFPSVDFVMATDDLLEDAVTVDALPSDAPPNQPPAADCPCGSPLATATPGAMRAPNRSAGGVEYGTGFYRRGKPGPTSGGYGSTWSTSSSGSNAPGSSDGVSGLGTAQCAIPQVVQVNGNASVAVKAGPGSAVFFDKIGGAYRPRFGQDATLVHDTGADEFELTDGAGSVFTFNDFTVGSPGLMKSMADAAGNVTAVTAWDASGAIGEVQRVDGTGGSARTESFLYTYVASGANAGLVDTITQRTKVGTGSWTTVRTTEYTYYTTGMGVPGLTGNVKAEVVKDGAGTAIDTTYYRYYTSGPEAGQLKFAFGPAAQARLAALATSLSTTVDALSEGQIDDHADLYLEYDSSVRVTTAISSGTGCSACSGGQGEFTYAYTTNTNWDGSLRHNVWATKTVETLPDSTTNTVYTDPFGQVMLRVHTENSQDWMTYYRYDAEGRVILEANPSAVTGLSEGNLDLVGYGSTYATYLDDDDGLVTKYTYAASTTATSSTAGDAAGYFKEVAILHGEQGTAVKQQAATYIMRTVGSVDLFFPAASTVYRNDNGTGGQTTTATYTWQGSTATPASVTTTLPAVGTAQNGPNSATSMTAAYDGYGRPIWQKDQGGFLTYTEYDVVTGGVTKQITDVDHTATSDFANLPSGWTTPSGGGLHLITTLEVDDQGRPTKVTHPNGRIDYTVYKDALHEARSYYAWDTGTNAPTGPTVVTREDRAGNYTETLTMSATPALNSGRPTGGESIGSLQSLSREYRNDAGQTIYSDAYFDLGGLAYSTSTSLGTSGVNFYRTTTGYSKQGQPNKSVSPEGTIYRTVFDGLGRVVSEWVGTDDTPSSGFWSPSNLTGTNMVMVREYEYDGGGVGDSNLTSVTEHPGLSQPDRVTETYYDWRNRAVAMKAGVEGSENTGVNRPIVYRTFDNLGAVTQTRMYDGDGVTISYTNDVPDAPSSSLRRAQSATSFDELGRAYRTDTYSVNPSSGSVGSDTLYSLTWFDSRGQVIKTLSPGGLVQKLSYDGAGRTTVAYTTDGGGDSGYSDADDVSGDAVLEQVEYGYDDSGNMLTTTYRQRFHDETSTGALGTPSSGVEARVYYSGNYYDKADRPVASVNVGTNGGSAWSLPGSVPSRSDTVLVTSMTYAADAVQTVRLTGSPTGGTFTLTFGGDTTSGIAYNATAATVQTALQGLTSIGSGNALVIAAPGGGWEVRFAGTLAGKYQARITASGTSLTGGTTPAVVVSTISIGGDAGRAATTTDPRALVSRSYADALGRTVRTVENFVDGAVADADDKTTNFTYNSVGMTSLTAQLTGGGGQTTAWVYGVTQTDSGITSNDVVGETRWPDPSTGAASGSEEETVTVNALGQTVTSEDRNGNVHTYTYDVLGRVASDAVTTLGGGVDNAVLRIETAYDGQGNPYLITSYDADTGGSVVNQVMREYNGLGQMTAEWQEHAGAVDTETTIDLYTSPVVQYAYSEMPSGANHSRLTSVTYPSGYVLTYNYSSGLNSSISRLSSLSDGTGTLESYEFLGLSTVVIRSHPQPDVSLTYVAQGYGDLSATAGDQYTGLDQFGRVVDQRWVDTSPLPPPPPPAPTDRFQYGYDRNGNRTYRDNLVNTAFGELYAYDGLNQLTAFDRGVLSSGGTVISSPTRSQDWDFDALGNFDSVTTNGGSPVTRTTNAQNEITSISGATTPTYDANGNMTGDETGKTFVYDAWNRLVEVKSGATILEAFSHDGLMRRVGNTVGATTTDLYYSNQWQVVEETVGSNTTTRYVWSPVYVDALVLRDRDTDANGTLDERLWVQQDANYNVTAVVDGSGAVVERYAYDPFGSVTIYSPSYTVRSGGSSYAWQYNFQGLRHDPTSGLDEANHREYSPTLGRWTIPDPIRFSGEDANLYRFVNGNPIIYTDPSGLVKIRVQYNPVPGLPGLLGFYHAYIIVTDENGKEYYYRAGPSKMGSVSESSKSNPKEGMPKESSYGPIFAEGGEYKAGTIDWTVDPKVPSTPVLDNNDPAGPYLMKLDEMVKFINDQKIPYKPTGPNSNTFAYQVIQGLGLQPPKTPPKVTVPGSGDKMMVTPMKGKQDKCDG